MKSFQQFLSESINISGDFNGNLYMSSPNTDSPSVKECFIADVVWEGKLYRMEIEGSIIDKNKLTEQLQNQYPGSIVHNVYPFVNSDIKIKSSQRYRPESLTWSD